MRQFGSVNESWQRNIVEVENLRINLFGRNKKAAIK